MDFFVVPTVGFRLLYVWFVIVHGRRGIIHFNVMPNPTPQWVVQQLRESFPDDSGPRFLIYDNDSRPTQSQALGKLRLPWIFSNEVSRTIKSLGVTPKRTAYRSPWQNGTAERSVGLCKRAIETRPSSGAKVIGLPRVGGRHRRYIWQEAT